MNSAKYHKKSSRQWSTGWESCKRLNFTHTTKWYIRKPEPVIATKRIKF